VKAGDKQSSSGKYAIRNAPLLPESVRIGFVDIESVQLGQFDGTVTVFAPLIPLTGSYLLSRGSETVIFGATFQSDSASSCFYNSKYINTEIVHEKFV
jgi:hypothetical protein